MQKLTVLCTAVWRVTPGRMLTRLAGTPSLGWGFRDAHTDAQRRMRRRRLNVGGVVVEEEEEEIERGWSDR
jgi:hypothetical protein